MKKAFTLLALGFALFISAQPVRIDPAINSEPQNIFVFKDKLYYSSSVAGNGNFELYVYDRQQPLTVNNPHMLVDLDSTGSSYPRFFASHNGKLFFSVNSGLYSYVDTLPVSATNPKFITNKIAVTPVSINSKLYFSAYVGPGKQTMYVYDDNQPVGLNNPSTLVPNGASELLTDYPSISISFDNKLFFQASDAMQSGYELWIYDPSLPVSNSNPLLNDLHPDTASDPFYNGSNPKGFLPYKGKLYFVAKDGEDYALWAYTPNTGLAKVFNTTFLPQVVYGDTLYGIGGDLFTIGQELYRFNGVDSPSLVVDLMPDLNDGVYGPCRLFENKMLFGASNSTTGQDWWCFDNHLPVSASNPFLVTDMFPGFDAGPNHMDDAGVQYGNRFYFGSSTTQNFGGLYAFSLCDVRAAVPPVFSLGADTTLNVGNSVPLSGPVGATSYNWSTGATSNQFVFNGSLANLGTNNLALTVVDTNNCNYTDTIVITVTPATNIAPSNLNELTFAVYPNPANGFFNVIADRKMEELTITNSIGQVVYSVKPSSNSFAAYLNTAGIYTITVTNSNKTFIKRLVITN